jgi:hypothetical protein
LQGVNCKINKKIVLVAVLLKRAVFSIQETSIKKKIQETSGPGNPYLFVACEYVTGEIGSLLGRCLNLRIIY